VHISLAFGKVIEQDHATAAQDLSFMFMAAGLSFASRDNRCSLHGLLKRRWSTTGR
jgi:hypothetical protein